jgi:hypothetical protein
VFEFVGYRGPKVFDNRVLSRQLLFAPVWIAVIAQFLWMVREEEIARSAFFVFNVFHSDDFVRGAMGRLTLHESKGRSSRLIITHHAHSVHNIHHPVDLVFDAMGRLVVFEAETRYTLIADFAQSCSDIRHPVDLVCCTVCRSVFF